jgi:hypothetical protein
MRWIMEPGIRGKAPFNGTPTPNVCPGCGDKLFSAEPGVFECELCGTVIRVPQGTFEEDGWGGRDIVEAVARPAIPPHIFRRQRRETGAVTV